MKRGCFSANGLVGTATFTAFAEGKEKLKILQA